MKYRMRCPCPFKMEKFLSVNCDIRSECITAEKKCYIIKATLKEQYRKVMQLTDIYDISCKVSNSSTILRMYSSTKGLVYITEYDVKNEKSFQEDLQKKHNINEVGQAFWIKPKNSKSTPYLITFSQSQMPATIYVPGEDRLKCTRISPDLYSVQSVWSILTQQKKKGVETQKYA